MFSFFKKNLNSASLTPRILRPIKYILSAFFITDLFKFANATYCFNFYGHFAAFDSIKKEESIYNATAAACYLTSRSLDNCKFESFPQNFNFGDGYFGGYYCSLYLDVQQPANCLVDTIKANCPSGFGTTEDYLVTAVIAGAGAIALSSIFLFAVRRRAKHAVEAAAPEETQTVVPAQPNLRKKLLKIAPGSLLELIVATGVSLAVKPFINAEQPWFFNPLLSSNIIVLINILLRIPDSKKFAEVSLYARSILFAFINFNTIDALLHESGHALAFLSLYKNSNPQIEITNRIYGAGGDTTSSNEAALSATGIQLGFTKSDQLIHFGGAAADVVSNSIAMVVAQALPDKYPEIKLYIRVSCLVHMSNTLGYAMSAYADSMCDNFPGHDFCELKKQSLAPWVLAAIMLESILLLQILLSTCKMGCRKSKNIATDIELEALSTPMLDETSITVNEEKEKEEEEERAERRLSR